MLPHPYLCLLTNKASLYDTSTYPTVRSTTVDIHPWVAPQIHIQIPSSREDLQRLKYRKSAKRMAHRHRSSGQHMSSSTTMKSAWVETDSIIKSMHIPTALILMPNPQVTPSQHFGHHSSHLHAVIRASAGGVKLGPRKLSKLQASHQTLARTP